MTLVKAVFSVIGIYACFLTWGVLQERVSTTPYGELRSDRFRYFVFLNMIQSLMASIVAFVYLLITRQSIFDNISSKLYIKLIQISFFGTIGSPFGYESLKHIDYPTMILGKSCKLVPVMLMSKILNRKTFPPHKYVVVFLITVGVTSFMLLQPISEKKKTMASNSFYGILLLTINLLIDGITNSKQDQIFDKFKISGQQMMFFMNLFCGLLMFIYLILPINHELNNAIEFCIKYPKVLEDILLFSLCGALGQCFIFFTLKNFGSLFLVTITVTRKLFTILLSIFWFEHHLNVEQWFAVLLVFFGIGLEAFNKQSDSSKKQLDNINKKKLVEKTL
ncbi:2635_t:CDS:1 [Funneliformis geosporum]|uniref:UDP-galactose transporter homolog 1 n=1 Tax=Funneliformis geosporum TaxID=1117311 RepID=A0A9W4SUZ0_9GLOM|nr:8726_t:CDS:1 [Funneliformis geosporum]CAI2186271.1 2635_t:CDS:1 [Funneliformis geosporum]